jgi:thiamine biosynthesis lipoprotein
VTPPPSTRTWEALGTTVLVGATRSAELAAATAAVRRVLDAVDRSCSRFRADSELSRVNAAGGAAVRVSPLFVRAALCALRAARITDGDLDPTIGASLRAVGYDRDFAQIRSGTPVRFTRAAGWSCVRLDEDASLISVPAGVELDFGATAKALAADIAAAEAGAALAGGVLVSLGGDLALAGPPPPGGWPVRVADDHRAGADTPGQTIALHTGGLATSSTTVRRWGAGTGTLHHILDPASGAPAGGPWRTVSVAAGSCVDANIASTTAIIRGAAAPAWLGAAGLPARLVDDAGAVTLTAGWPAADLVAA